MSRIESEGEARAARESRLYRLFFGVVLVGWVVVAATDILLAPAATRWSNAVLTLIGGSVVTLAVNRPDRRRAVVAATLLDVLSLAVPTYAPAGFGAAIIFPLLGGLLLVPSHRGRTLVGSFVLGWAVSVAGMAISFVIGPMSRLSTLTYPPTTVATGALVAALAYVTVWWVASQWRLALTDARAAAGQYRALIEQAADGILVLDRDGRVVDMNPRVEHVLGRPARDLLGHRAAEFIAPAGEAGRPVDLSSLQPGQSMLSERIITNAAGIASPVELRVSAMRDGRYQVIVRDLTEHRRADAERARLAAALDQTSDGVAVMDLEGVVTYANPAFLGASGLGKDAVVGRPTAEVAGELMGSAGPAELERTALAATPSLQEVDRTGADGTTRHLQISVTPVRDASATVTSFVVVARDITDLRTAEEELALEARVRVALAESLHNIPQDASLEQAAQAICDELVKLPFVDLASVDVFLGSTDVQILGHSSPPAYPVKAGDRLPPYRAAIVREQVARGPWAGYPTADPDESGGMAGGAAASLKALAFGPLVHGEEVVGALVIGTFDERFARTIVETTPAIVSFSATSSALLAERMHAMRLRADLRQRFAHVLASRSFHPVFQPIVDLDTREAVAYEALTRFDSGQRPDLAFADAWSVGLGADLEIATLEAAVAASKGLASGLWLDLNVSPRLLADPERLAGILWPAERPLVLEITEHELIDDYGSVREAIRGLGHDVRLAVDDAGAGVANFGHIIELRPDLVKLDMSLVRRVNANFGRQALVVAMRHFSRTAGCRLIAEGVETEEEARTLAGLGVEFGQGHLFGRPELVEAWAPAPVPLD